MAVACAGIGRSGVQVRLQDQEGWPPCCWYLYFHASRDAHRCFVQQLLCWPSLILFLFGCRSPCDQMGICVEVHLARTLQYFSSDLLWFFVSLLSDYWKRMKRLLVGQWSVALFFFSCIEIRFVLGSQGTVGSPGRQGSFCIFYVFVFFQEQKHYIWR